jgi:hypothetical protein
MTKRHKMFTIILMWTSIGMTSILPQTNYGCEFCC